MIVGHHPDGEGRQLMAWGGVGWGGEGVRRVDVPVMAAGVRAHYLFIVISDCSARLNGLLCFQS